MVGPHGGCAAESWAGGGAEQSDARDAQVAEALWNLAGLGLGLGSELGLGFGLGLG